MDALQHCIDNHCKKKTIMGEHFVVFMNHEGKGCEFLQREGTCGELEHPAVRYARPNADLFIPPFLGLFQPFPNFYTLL